MSPYLTKLQNFPPETCGETSGAGGGGVDWSERMDCEEIIVPLEGFEEEETTPEHKPLWEIIFELKLFEIIRDLRTMEDIFIRVFDLAFFLLMEILN